MTTRAVWFRDSVGIRAFLVACVARRAYLAQYVLQFSYSLMALLTDSIKSQAQSDGSAYVQLLLLSCITHLIPAVRRYFQNGYLVSHDPTNKKSEKSNRDGSKRLPFVVSINNRPASTVDLLELAGSPMNLLLYAEDRVTSIRSIDVEAHGIKEGCAETHPCRGRIGLTGTALSITAVLDVDG
jgi:hypothetical protein